MLFLIHKILQLYIYIIIAEIVLSYLPQFKSQKWAQIIHRLADATLRPVRDLLPQNLPIDLSPMIVIILIQMLMFLL